IGRADIRRCALELDNGAPLDAGEAAEIFKSAYPRCPEIAVDAFDPDQMRAAGIMAKPLEADQSARHPAMARMRLLQFACAAGFEATVLLRQETRRDALPLARVGQAGEFVFKLGVEAPRPGPVLLSQPPFFEPVKALDQRTATGLRQVAHRDF